MGGSEQFVDVSYRGLELGKGLRISEVGPTTAFLEHAAPLPVGAEIEIATGGGAAFSARVIRVHEQVAGAEVAAGMRVQVDGLDGAARRWWDEQQSAEDPAALPAAESKEGANETPESGEGSGGNGAPAGHTLPMASAEIRAATGKDGAGETAGEGGGADGAEDGANGRDGKRKRRRRGKKKR